MIDIPSLALAAFSLPEEPVALLVAVATLVFAYAIFALAGFGTGLIASAPLAAVMPVSRVIPLLALLDCLGSVSRGWRARRAIAGEELRELLPGMLLGQLLGVFFLARLPAAPLALALGGFVAVQGLRGLAGGKPAGRQPGRAWASGLFGGVLGGLFGSGGFVYAAYLERRLDSREAFRATLAVLIALSTAWRVGLCAASGLIDLRLLATAILLVPALGAGMLVGRHIDLRLTRERLFQLLNVLLVASGAGLALRHAFL